MKYRSGTQPKGRLIIIGGREKKWSEDDRPIVEEIAAAARRTKIVVITVATKLPEELWEDYHKLFKKDLGVKTVELLDIRTREDAYAESNVAKLTEGAVVFFTGGDQLRIASQVGDSLVYRRMRELYHRGATICGTSAGAAAMPETMLVAGTSDATARTFDLDMAPGLGLVRGVIIDSHFAERGRMGRLLSAVAHNPKNIGLGIDEDTAVVVEGGGTEGVDSGRSSLRVIGSGGVYVVDGTRIDYSSLSEQKSERVLTICNVTLHVLGNGDSFDLAARSPMPELSADEKRSLTASKTGRLLEGAPKYSTIKNGSPKHGSSRNGAGRNGAPRNGSSRNGSSGNGSRKTNGRRRTHAGASS